jgi:hypothetical protein
METKPKPRKRSASQRARSTASWKNLVCRLDSSPALHLAAAALIWALATPAWTTAGEAPSAPASSISIYSSADESAPPIGSLDSGENATPIAESQGAGGAKWFLIKNRNGVVGWIKQAGGEQANKVESFFKSLPPEPSSTAVPTISSTAAPSGSIVVPVLSTGRATIVSVTFNHSITANLMLDTGATNSLVSRRIANALSLRPIASSVIHTVGGAVNVAIARVQSMKVGAAEINELPVIVHDFSPDPRFEGLLGMDFLSRYRFGLDTNRQLLVLSPR